MRNNLTKNRYTDVLCYDHSRVVLAREDDDELSDYINANFVDGYKQKNAYISTQGESSPSESMCFLRLLRHAHLHGEREREGGSTKYSRKRKGIWVMCKCRQRHLQSLT